MTAVLSYGAYVPPYRIERSSVARQYGRGASPGTTAVPARDENVITMACEAAGRALETGPVAIDDLAAVLSASVSDPFAEHGLAAHVAYRFGAPEALRTLDLRGSSRAGGDALATARDLLRARDGAVLVVGSDSLPVERGDAGEAYAGAGAGCLILGDEGNTVLARLSAVAEHTNGFVEFPRRHGRSYEAGDGRFERAGGFEPAARTVFETLRDHGGEAPSALVSPARDPRLARRARKICPGDPEAVSTFEEVGWAGAASFFLDVSRWLDDAGTDDVLWALAYGAGGADGFALRAIDTDRPGSGLANQLGSRRDVTYAQHLRFREHPYTRGGT